MTATQRSPLVELLDGRLKTYVQEAFIEYGRGKHRGGDGLVREIELLADAEVAIISERRRFSPWGLQGGKPGKRGRNLLIRGRNQRVLPGKFHGHLKAGDRIRIETPGGGGWGKVPRGKRGR